MPLYYLPKNYATNLAGKCEFLAKMLRETFPKSHGYFPLAYSACVKRDMLNLGGLIQFKQVHSRTGFLPSQE